MSGFIPEITTVVKVNTKTNRIDKSLQLLQSDKASAYAFTDIIDWLKRDKQELEELSDVLAKNVSEKLKDHQRDIIKERKHIFSGMMYNSVDITKDGTAQYLVGNTATSVDGFPYPLAIETGRKTVYPIEAKMLRWWTGPWFSGDVVFAKKSKAVAADPFVEKSIDRTANDLEALVDNFLDKSLNGK